MLTNLMMEDLLNRCVGEVVQVSCGPCTITGKLEAGTLNADRVSNIHIDNQGSQNVLIEIQLYLSPIPNY